MTIPKALFLAVLPLLLAAAGCGGASPAANPKIEGQAKTAIAPVNRPTAENVGPADKNGKPRSLTPDY